MCMRQSRKVIWDIINTLFVTTVAVEATSVAFLANICPWPPVQFTQKPPTKPFGIVACTFSDNLSRNSCMWKM